MAFDPDLATKAWMATLDGAARARSDAYFEGGYWLILWGFLASVAADLAILRLGWARRLSTRVQAMTQRKSLQSLLFAIPYLLLASLLVLPLTIYQEFVREHQYGLLNQGFGEWAIEAAIVIVINALLFGLLFVGLHAVIRRSPKNWWLMGTGITIAGLIMFLAIAPVYVDPLLNDYTPVPEGPKRAAIVALATANAVPADDVVVVDASRQSDRISANVSGLFGAARIALNDNLMKQPQDEIRAVMAHEIGHYVLNHVWKKVLVFALLTALVFAVVSRALPWLLARHGPGWGVTRLDDPAILPVINLVVSTLALLLTPVTNTLTRIDEIEADRFSLDAARAPEAFASVAMKAAFYRKIEPGPIEEMLFFDHPSGHTRVQTAMRWKAEHLDAPDIR
jgi:STE24 endopeptidase